MRKFLAVLAPVVVALACQQVLAQQNPQRQPVTLPADAKAIFKAQMLGHVVGLDAVISALGEGDYKAAAELASTELGTRRFQESAAAKSRDQSPGVGVGQYLPDDFKTISARFRQAADEFAELAGGMPAVPSSVDQQALFAALAKITNECRICHDAYRVD